MTAPWRLLDPIAAEHYTLVTTLSADECQARLQEQLVTWSFPRNLFLPPVPGPIQGSVTTEGFAITKYTPLMRNTMRPQAWGQFVRESNGTRIALRIGSRPGRAVLMLAWLCLALFLATISVLAALSGRQEPSGAESAVLLPLLLPIGGVFIFVIGRVLAQGEDVFLLAFLRETLEAEEVEQVDADDGA